jgi:hypothetical protein
MDEDATLADPPNDDRSIATAAPLSGPGHALLNEAATEIGIDNASFCSLDRFTKAIICDPLPAREPREFLRLEDSHGPSPPAHIYSAARYSGRGAPFD